MQHADVTYVIFCRIDGLKTMPADRVAASVEALRQVIDRSCADYKGVVSHTSVYGRFVLVPYQPGKALCLARTLLADCAKAGVSTAIGVAAGRIEATSDVKEKEQNVAGTVINRAARLAHLTDGRFKVAVDEEVVETASRAKEEFGLAAFSSKQRGKVKTDDLEFRWLTCEQPSLGPPPPINSGFEPEQAHVVVYDIAGFSKQKQADLVRSVEDLKHAVHRALHATGGDQLAEGSERWYAPAGDGGVMVFRAVRHGSRAALAFADKLVAHAEDRVDIRIGVASGPIVVLQDGLPVGTGIIKADELSGIPQPGSICIDRHFWESILENADRAGWHTKSIQGRPDALLIGRPRNLERSAVPSDGKQTLTESYCFADPDVKQPPSLRQHLADTAVLLDSRAELELIQVLAKPRTPDIQWTPVAAIEDKDLPLERKTPALHELRTEQQLRDHFVVLPRMTAKADDWLKNRDLLFLGLPFCGKTSLLTWLALETARRCSNLVPIYLQPRDGLTINEAQAAADNLELALRQAGQLQIPGRRAVLILDNVHREEIFAIAQHLMKSNRQWRLWAAARAGDLNKLLTSRRCRNPWSDNDRIEDVCGLAGRAECNFMVDNLLRPSLKRNQEENLLEPIRKALHAKGQMPMRTLVSVWRMVECMESEVDFGYSAMIAREPNMADQVVDGLWPHSRIGLDAVAIVDYLRNPPWALLRFVLGEVGDYGRERADACVFELRRSLTLIADSLQPARASMYDPMREQLRKDGGLPKCLREDIWKAVSAYLMSGKAASESGGLCDEIFYAWCDLHEIATREARYDLAIAIARCAADSAPIAERGRAFALLGRALCEHPSPKWAEAIVALEDAVRFLSDGPLLASAHWTIADCLSRQLEPDRISAAQHLSRAAELFTEPHDKAVSFLLLGDTLRTTSQPDWAGAIVAYRRSADLLPNTDVSCIAYCMMAISLGQQADAATDPEQVGRLRGEEIAAFRKAVDANAKNGWAWTGLGCCLGQQADAATDPEQVHRLRQEEIAAYRKAVEANTKNGWAWTGLGICLARQADTATDPEQVGRLRQEEIAAYRKAGQANTKNGWAWTHLGMRLAQQADAATNPEEVAALREEEIAAYRKTVEANRKDGWAWTRLGMRLGQQADAATDPGKVAALREEEIAAYRKAVEANTENDRAWYNLAFRLGQQADAATEPEQIGRLRQEEIAAYRKAAEANAKDHQAWYNLAFCLGQQADAATDSEQVGRLRQEEIAAYRKAVEANAKDDRAWTNLAIRLGQEAEAVTDPEKVATLRQEDIAACRKAVEANAKNDIAWNRLSFMLASEWHISRNARLLDEALNAAKNAAALGDHRYNLACVLALNDETEEALRQLDGCLGRKEIDRDRVRKDRDWDGLHGNPRFQALMNG